MHHAQTLGSQQVVVLQCKRATDLALAARAEVMVGYTVACLLAVSAGLLDLLHHARAKRPHGDLDP